MTLEDQIICIKNAITCLNIRMNNAKESLEGVLFLAETLTNRESK